MAVGTLGQGRVGLGSLAGNVMAAFRDFLLAEIETNAAILRMAGVQPE